MKMKTILAAALCLGVCMLFIGCGGAANTTTNTATTNTAAKNTTTTTTTSNTTDTHATNSNSTSSANSTSSDSAKSGDSAEPNTGVAECDEYIKKYEACLTKIAKAAPQVEGPMKQAFEAQRSGFKTAASNPASKATLSSTCKQAMETAKTSTKSYACEW